MKSDQQSVWPAAYSFLLFALVFLFFAFGAATAPLLPMRCMLAALALSCAELYLNAVRPDSPLANRWGRVLTRCATGLFYAGMIAAALEYLATFM